MALRRPSPHPTSESPESWKGSPGPRSSLRPNRRWHRWLPIPIGVALGIPAGLFLASLESEDSVEPAPKGDNGVVWEQERGS